MAREDGIFACFRSRPFRVSALLLAALLSFVPKLSAQPGAVERVVHDTKGKEYWVCFMQNNGSGGDYETSDLRLYISSDTVTEIRIRYTPVDDTLRVRITRPNVPIEIDLNTLWGETIELDEVGETGFNAVQQKSFHIMSDADITLYGVNIRVMSSDAFLALPDDVLTDTYAVLAWPNGYLSVPGNPVPSDYDMHSQFAVVATEDGTTVRIAPTALLSGRRTSEPFTVLLDQGEVYFGQAVLGIEQDVTGTTVRSNKPVAVFAGNQRSAVPLQVGNFRNHLVEQMPPVQAWGKTAVLTPHYPITPSSSHESSVRILAAEDGTQVTVEGTGSTRNYVLNAMQSVELSPIPAAHVTATGPILVAQYEHSVGQISPNPEDPAELGDPFQMILPPPEQYDTAYSFQSVPHPEFPRHYINVIVERGKEDVLLLDGTPIVANFLPVPGNFSYAQIEVTEGAHFIESIDRSRFGLCVYGFGRANAYGYVGGMLFRELVVDYSRPEISLLDRCDLLSGNAIDAGLTDSGIDSLYVVPESAANVDVRIDSFDAGAERVPFTVQLIDPYQDGAVEMKAVDRSGRSWTERHEIPGFTVNAVGMVGNDPVDADLVSFNGDEYCRTIVLTNYGAHSQEIASLLLAPDTLAGLRTTTSLPLTLLPGETREITICYAGNVAAPIEVGLRVGDSCIGRNVALMNVLSIVDTLPPSLSRVAGSCDGAVTLEFGEVQNRYLAVEEVRVDTMGNGRFTEIVAAPAQRTLARIEAIDPREDVVYQVTAKDRAGNLVTVRDTVGGFTLAFTENPGTDRLAIRLQRDWVVDSLNLGDRRCDSLLLTNYGLRPLSVARILMLGNTEFSIPPAQLPIALAPGEARRVAVCLGGKRAGDQIDTLLVLDACGRWENVQLMTPVKAALGTGADRCASLITIQAFGAAKRTFLTVPAPNPANRGGLVSVDLGLQRDESVSLEICNLIGVPVLGIVRDEPLQAGVHRIEFPSSQLESGVWYCRLTTESGEQHVAKLVIRE